MPEFENGSVDAWAIWEPFVSLQSLENGAAVLANGETIDTYSRGFTIVRSGFADSYPKEVKSFFKFMIKPFNGKKKTKKKRLPSMRK